MGKQDDDYSEFDEVNDLLVLPEQTTLPQKGNHEVLYMYNNRDELMYISRSTQVHKLKDRPWWPTVTLIKIERHGTKGQAEDAKLVAVDQLKPKYNIRTTL